MGALEKWQHEQAETILDERRRHFGHSWGEKSDQERYDACAVGFMRLVNTLTPQKPVQHTELQGVIRALKALIFGT